MGWYMNNQLNPKFSVGDRITWFCDDDGEIHSSTVLYVNKAMTATGMEINYEVELECLGGCRIFFVDEMDVVEVGER